jgi:hypothetical protein
MAMLEESLEKIRLREDYNKSFKNKKKKSEIDKKRTKVKFRKFYRNLMSPFKTKEIELSDKQKAAIKLVRHLILDKNSVFSIAPLSNTCYIDNEDYYIVLTSSFVSIDKGNYIFLEVHLPFEENEKLMSFYNKTVENIRKAKEVKRDSQKAAVLNMFTNELTNKSLIKITNG